jgi:hypothetical protein
MKTHRLELQLCPWCGYNLDAASNTEPGVEEAPDPGDTSVCFSCAQPLVMSDQGQWQKMSQAELNRLHPKNREQMEKVMRMVREAPLNLRGKAR